MRSMQVFVSLSLPILFCLEPLLFRLSLLVCCGPALNYFDFQPQVFMTLQYAETLRLHVSYKHQDHTICQGYGTLVYLIRSIPNPVRRSMFNFGWGCHLDV